MHNGTLRRPEDSNLILGKKLENKHKKFEEKKRRYFSAQPLFAHTCRCEIHNYQYACQAFLD